MTKCGILIGLAAAGVLALHTAAFAQTAVVTGSLGNFDVANNQQQDAHGFEIEFEGIHPEDVSSTFETERYGAPTIVATATGTVVRWASGFDPALGFTATTAQHDPAAPLTGACYQWAGPDYDAAGCEHFGVTLGAAAAGAAYRWLVADPQAPGSLTAGPVPVAVATPAYWVAPPTNGAAPLLNADVDAPPRADYPTRYGDALWVKIFRRPLARQVSLNELTNDNPGVVPEDSSSVEVTWVLIQADPLIQFGTNNQKQSRQRTRNGGPLNAETGAVVRRYEVYKYTGLYDPFFHQVVCGNANCASPAAQELGDLISAQMTAANVVVPSVSVTTVGSGTVTSNDGRINCGGNCSAFYAAGSSTTLTVSTRGGDKFTGWSGACSGTAATCMVTVDQHLNVGATFAAATPSATTATTTPVRTGTALVTLSIGLSNKGSVISDNGSINCPGACSAKFPVGTTITLTAAPTVGSFQSWTDACTGTGSTCTFAITNDSKVQATFNK